MIIGFKTKSGSKYFLKRDETGRIVGIMGGIYFKNFVDVYGTPRIIIGAPALFDLGTVGDLKTSPVTHYIYA